jgi:hypothetical protein
MKKPSIVQTEDNQSVNSNIYPSFESITKGLDIADRTIKPPTKELVKRLNEMASKPPFSIIYKVKDIHPIL